MYIAYLLLTHPASRQAGPQTAPGCPQGIISLLQQRRYRDWVVPRYIYVYFRIQLLLFMLFNAMYMLIVLA